MTFSVIIISWNNLDELRACLKSLERQSNQNFETILIDNHSSDETVYMVKTEFPKVTLHEMDSNLGFAEGCNRAIEISKGDWICTLNSDAVAAPDWIEQIQSAINLADVNTGMFQSKVIFKENRDQTNSTGILLLATGSSGDRGLNAPVQSSPTPQEIFAPSACAAVYKREMLLEAKLESGIFDRTFFMYAEDLDLGWRCRLMGWKALYLPTAIVFHGYQGSSKIRGKYFADLQCRENRVRALLKNASAPFLLICIPKTIYDFFVVLRHKRLDVFSLFYNAARDGLRQRKSVTKLRALSRREIEKKWVVWALKISTSNQ